MISLAAALMAMQIVSDPMTVAACAAARTSPADRSMVVQNMLNGGESGDSDDRVTGNIIACKAGQMLTPTEASGTLALIANGEVGRELALLMINPRQIDKWFAAGGRGLNIGAGMSAEDTGRMLESLAAAGLPRVAVNRHSDRVGLYVRTLILMDRIERGLPSTP